MSRRGRPRGGYSGYGEAPSYQAGEDHQNQNYYPEEYRSGYTSYNNNGAQAYHDGPWSYEQNRYDAQSWGASQGSQGREYGYDEHYYGENPASRQWQAYDQYQYHDARYADYPSYSDYPSSTREYPTGSSYSGYADYRQTAPEGGYRDYRDRPVQEEYDERAYTEPHRSTGAQAHPPHTRGYTTHAQANFLRRNSPSRSPVRPSPPRRTEPRDEYLAVSLRPSPHLEDPTAVRKLIVLDLNGSLLLRGAHQKRAAQPRRGAPVPHLRAVHRRPYLTSFVSYILHDETKKWLDTMVWSSAQPHSVADMVDNCFGARKSELKAVWARDTLGLTSDDYNRKSITLKDLEKPWEELSPRDNSKSTPAAFPTKHSALTTLLVDDSPAKAALQPWNHLCIKEYLQASRNLDLIVAHWEATQRDPTTSTTAVTQSAQSASEAEAGEVNEHPPPTNPGVRRIIREVVMIDGAMVDPSESIVEDKLVYDPPAPAEDGAFIPNLNRKMKRLAQKEALRKERAEKEREAFFALYAQQEQTRRLAGGDETSAQADVAEAPAIPAPPPELRYDETLLAVVGVLDHIKHEGNVAGWVRSGGLLTTMLARDAPPPPPPVADESDDIASSPAQAKKSTKHSAPSRGSSEESSPPKRRKLSEADLQPPSSPAPTPPPSSQLTESATDAEDSVIVAPAQGNPASPSAWYENATVLSYWADRGREALKALGIPVESGMVAVPGFQGAKKS